MEQRIEALEARAQRIEGLLEAILDRLNSDPEAASRSDEPQHQSARSGSRGR